MRKCISLSDHDLELLEHCKKENGLTSDSATISFLLNKHLTEKEELAVVIRQELEKNYLPAQRIRWGGSNGGTKYDIIIGCNQFAALAI